MARDIKREFEDEADKLARKYSDEIFKHNPNGFTVAPYVNEDTMSDSFDQGYRQGALESSVVKKMEYELKIQIEIVSAISGFNTENIRLAKEALNELKILRGGGE